MSDSFKVSCQADFDAIKDRSIRRLFVEGCSIVIENITFLTNGAIYVSSGVYDITIRKCILPSCQVKIENGCRNIIIVDCEISSFRRGPAILANDSDVDISECSIKDCIVGIHVSRSIQVRFPILESDCFTGVKIRENCNFSDCSTDLVVSLVLGYPDEYPVGVPGGCKINCESVLELETDCTCEVQIQGRFARPINFESWPPEDKKFQVNRRGSAGRKCRIIISSGVILIEEDGRVERSDPRKRDRKTVHSEDLSILGLNELPASHEELNKAFRKAALIHHPDKSHNREHVEISFIDLMGAKDRILLALDQSEAKRKKYIKL